MADIRYAEMALTDLIPADYNPRKISEDALVGLENTIARFGIVQPIVWNKRTRNVVGGHQRLKVLQGQRVERTVVCQVDLSLEEEKALNVALNNPHITGDFDSTLQALLKDIREDDEDLFRDVHLDKLLEEETAPSAGADDAPPVPEEPVSKPGDLYILGEHRLLCGSSTHHPDVMRLIGDRHATCMWTDPPYGVDYVGKTKDAKTIKNDGKADLAELLRGAFNLAFEYVLAPGSAVYVAHPAGDNDLTFYLELNAAGFRKRQHLIWSKSSFALGRSDYHYRHEPVWYGFKPGDERFGRGGQGWHGDNAQDSIFEVPKPKRNGEHPTMKPVELITQMLANSSRPRDWVYEPFAGSGSTLIACQELGRRCLAMELDPAYVDVIVQRWEGFTGAKARREGADA